METVLTVCMEWLAALALNATYFTDRHPPSAQDEAPLHAIQSHEARGDDKLLL
jgi:hypothetical protein